MQINLGGAVAGAATAISVLDEYFQELYRIQRIPPSIPHTQGVVELTLLLDAPRFELVTPASGDPYTRLLLAGTVERRFGGNPPEVFPLDVKVLLTLVPLAEATVGLRFDGVDGTPLDAASGPGTRRENVIEWLRGLGALTREQRPNGG